MNKLDIRNDLEEKLAAYDRVFLISSDVQWFEAVFAESEALRDFGGRIWIYSGSETAYPASVSCGRISPKEEEEIRKLYHTYEFSDRFYVISRSRIHGTLFDYMDQGILSAEELTAVWMR
ncbi:MAG: hypothetical protein HFI15_08360 [Lachnospiraceae bacterium]|jgi:hypothetical protein|nr:hypothetical protein [Lachnospiraceae bacterium]